MGSPNDRRYLKTHEWHRADGDVVTIGVSRFAVEKLTDITFVEITADGEVAAGETIGEIESVKATSELYCGVAGTIVEINQEAIDNPAVLNEDPFEQGWLVRIRMSDPAQFNELLTTDQYDASTGSPA